MKTYLAKLSVGSLDDLDLTVVAQYNPSQLEMSRTIAWKSTDADNRPARGRQPQKTNDLEYTGAENRTLSIELLFDGYEENRCVEPLIEKLDRMATVQDRTAPRDQKRRPHHCVVVWGDGGMRPMPCVIESLAVKYTMFGKTGLPLRATATIKVREVAYTKPMNALSAWQTIEDDSDELDPAKQWKGVSLADEDGPGRRRAVGRGLGVESPEV